jgi:ubiquinone/menaquinone biosynthesis C-methylase UbiE
MSAQPNPAQVYEDYLVPHMFRPFARDLVRRAAPQPRERVLDVGCGTGVVARLAAPHVGSAGSVTGIDPNAAMLAVARQCAADEGLAIVWHEGDATSLPFADTSFDLVLCHQALQFVANRVAAAREIQRVLAPDGRALIATWSPIEATPVIAALDRIATAHLGVSGWTVPFSMGGADALGSLLREAGCASVEVESMGMTLRMPSYREYIGQQVRGAMAVVPALWGLSPAERDALVATIEAELRPQIGNYLDGETLLYPMQTDIATARMS